MEQSQRRLERRSARLCALCLAACTIAVYAPVRDCGFTNLDDSSYVTNNEPVQAGLTPQSVTWAFKTFVNANWHPLTWLSLQLDAELYGLSPRGFHLTNLLLHTASAVAIFWALARATGQVAPSFFVAALFALHPLHVESVAWISERKDVLSILFGTLAIGAYFAYVRQPTRFRSACVAVLYAASLASKPTLVTLPFLLVLLDHWPLKRASSGNRRELWKRLWEKKWLFALSAASCVITLIAQGSAGAIQNRGEFQFARRIANAIAAYGTYLMQMVWPVDLAPFYPYVERSFTDPIVWGSAILLLAITVAAICQVRQRPYLLVGWLWYLGTLVPMVGLVQVGTQAHADRYTYFPLIGVFVALAWLLSDLAKTAGSRRTVTVGAGIVVLGCAALTYRQVPYWKDSESLWKHTIDVTDRNATAHFGLGAAYRDQRRFDLAAEQFRLGLSIDPRFTVAHSALGWCLLITGRTTEAAAEFSQALGRGPEDPERQFEVALQLSRNGQSGVAVAWLTRLLGQDPTHSAAHLQLAFELLRIGELDAATRHLHRAVEIEPSLSELPEYLEAASSLEQSRSNAAQ